MNLRQLDHVIALADHRNFHRAANAVGLSQPALTQSIRNLEDEVGVALFERSKRDVTPTAFGAVMIQSARQTLAQLANLRRELALMKNLESGRLIVGCDAWVVEALVAPVLARMLEQYGDLRFSVRVGLIENLMDEMLSGAIDMCIGAPPETRDPRIDWHEIMLPPRIMVCNPSHPLLALADITPIDCLAYPIATPLLPRWYSDWLDKRLGHPVTADGRDIYSAFVESDDAGVLRHLVMTTDTLSAMLPSVAAEDIQRGQLRVLPIRELDFPTPAIICHAAGRPLAPAGRILLAALVEQAAAIESAAGILAKV